MKPWPMFFDISIMIYIWLDESDKEGQYYSNFYGGILMKSEDVPAVLEQAQELLNEIGVWEEIKWQKVNNHTFEQYKKIVDFIFQLLNDGKAKIRIFFRNNQHKATQLTTEHRHNGFTILYYEFIKHAFGLQYCDIPRTERTVNLFLDEIPVNKDQIANFRHYLVKLNNDGGMKQNGVRFSGSRIREVKSDKELPLQFLDLILGAICFRLNNKHLLKDPITNKRGTRTRLKEKLYKYINSKIRELRPNFNIGVSTGINSISDRWSIPYSHWSFKPTNHVIDKTQCK